MDENEAMDQMRDDIEPHNRPAHPTNPEMGQDTIEILEGSADVQITVTSCEAGPVYVRFLDSDGDVFGTDIDECETCEGASGADVVGLDSQQKLELNMGPTEMDAPMALMYDQYNVVTPGTVRTSTWSASLVCTTRARSASSLRVTGDPSR